ncbi:MAG: hypothetical protein J6R01_08080 [Alistipes sp.]|nr:hypothetical protein [Alistipes sp.]
MNKDIKKMCSIVEEEIEKIAGKGLSTANIDVAYKLIDMYANLKTMEYHDFKREYYEEEMGGYNEGGYGDDGSYGARRRRNSRGRYMADEYGARSGRGSQGGERGGIRGGYGNYGAYGADDTYGRYQASKQSYRAGGKSPECKERLVDTLEEYMEEFQAQMEEMLKDADCREERETINRYLSKIKSIA